MLDRSHKNYNWTVIGRPRKQVVCIGFRFGSISDLCCIWVYRDCLVQVCVSLFYFKSSLESGQHRVGSVSSSGQNRISLFLS